MKKERKRKEKQMRVPTFSVLGVEMHGRLHFAAEFQATPVFQIVDLKTGKHAQTHMFMHTVMHGEFTGGLKCA